MTTMIAVSLIAALYIVALLPLGLAARLGTSARTIAAAYLIAVAMLAFYQTGLLSTSRLADTDVSLFPTSITEADRCDEAVDLLREAGVILDRSPNRLIVAGARWDQLPPEIRDAVVNCVSATLPPGNNAVEVVRR